LAVQCCGNAALIAVAPLAVVPLESSEDARRADLVHKDFVAARDGHRGDGDRLLLESRALPETRAVSGRSLLRHRDRFGQFLLVAVAVGHYHG